MKNDDRVPIPAETYAALEEALNSDKPDLPPHLVALNARLKADQREVIAMPDAEKELMLAFLKVFAARERGGKVEP